MGVATSVLKILLIFRLPSKWPNFPFGPCIEHGGQKIELAQKIHASKDRHEMHANQFWWVWPLRFRRFCFFIVCHRNGQIFPSDHGIHVNTCRAKVNKMMVQLKASAYCIVYTTITQSINIEVQYDACTFYMYIYTSA